MLLTVCRYDLHVLLVNHGKRCPRCAKNGKPRKSSDGDCPLFGKKGQASSRQQLPDSSEEFIKSEEDSSDADDKTAVKQEPLENDIKQELEADTHNNAEGVAAVKEETD